MWFVSELLEKYISNIVVQCRQYFLINYGGLGTRNFLMFSGIFDQTLHNARCEAARTPELNFLVDY
jgi:hypothetical protein